jgi:hypothetical protein
MNNIDVVADKWLIDLATEKGLSWRLWEDDKPGLIKKCQALETSNGTPKELMKIAKLNAISGVKDDPLMGAILLDEMLEGKDLDKLSESIDKQEAIRSKLEMGKLTGVWVTSLAKNIGK